MTHAASAFAFPNLMIEHAWTADEYSKHRARIHEMKPHIDCATPSSYSVLLNRSKKEQLTQEWCARVDRDNQLLLSRLRHVMAHHSMAAEQNGQQFKHVSNQANRHYEQKRIDEANHMIAERIAKQQSAYNATSWKRHAAQYVREDKHLYSAAHQHKSAGSDDKKVHRLKPIDDKEWPKDEQGAPIYERQGEDPDVVAEAAASEAAEKEAIIDSFPLEFTDADAERSGPSEVNEHAVPKDAEVKSLYQSGHVIDGRQVIVCIDECNATSSKNTKQPTDEEEWSAFLAHPPAILHSLLIRTYDLDAATHSHLYLPYNPLKALGKTMDDRLMSVVPLLGFNAENELFFKKSAMKLTKSKKFKSRMLDKDAFVAAKLAATSSGKKIASATSAEASSQEQFDATATEERKVLTPESKLRSSVVTPVQRKEVVQEEPTPAPASSVESSKAPQTEVVAAVQRETISEPVVAPVPAVEESSPVQPAAVEQAPAKSEPEVAASKVEAAEEPATAKPVEQSEAAPAPQVDLSSASAPPAASSDDNEFASDGDSSF